MSAQLLPRDFTLRSKVMNLKLRRTWYDALIAIRNHGFQAWWRGIALQAKGSKKRMLNRMISCGYVRDGYVKYYETTTTIVTQQGMTYIKVCEEHHRNWRTSL